MSEHEFYHWGVKGMKWGVRRYQNSDGSLTAKGKQRYSRTTGHEDIANASVSGKNEHRKKVLAKYQHMKNAEQLQADAKRNKAFKDYNDYVERYSKSNKDTQSRYEHDFDHTKKGKKLINAIITSNEVREKAYAGAEWYAKYAKEMERAANKDYKSRW